MQNTPPDRKRRSSRLRILLIVVAVAIVTSAATVLVTMAYVFPGDFKPVKLSDREAQVLNAKLARLDTARGPAGSASGKDDDSGQMVRGNSGAYLKPERYSEAGASRQIKLSERELNGLLARNTDLAHKLAIDLSKDLASAKLLIPLDPDFPVLGGKTLRVNAGLELRYDDRNPVVMLKGVSICGVPIPNAWLGGLKNVDLVKEFGADRGFWHAFAAGVENIRVEEGNLSIKLKE
ncbi:MAG: arginine N-succinyltransferase [Deltaproteobacteria bacterium]|nr:arginine N-succinyltransferase [Deltaproteobacteria bacterium]